MQTSSDMVTALRDGWRPCNARVHGSHTHLHTSLARRSMLCRESLTCVQVECRAAAAPAGSAFARTAIARTAISHSRSLSAQRAGQRRYSSADGSLAASSQPHSHPQQQQHMLQGAIRAAFGTKIARAASAVAALLQYVQHLRWACTAVGHQRSTKKLLYGRTSTAGAQCPEPLTQQPDCRACIAQRHPGLCMGAAAAVPLTSFQGDLLHQLSNNYVFVVGFWAWFAAQFCKVGADGPITVSTHAHVRRCVRGMHTWSAAPADLHKTDKGGCLGHHGNRGLWRHAVVALGVVHGALSMACSIFNDDFACRAAAALGQWQLQRRHPAARAACLAGGHHGSRAQARPGQLPVCCVAGLHLGGHVRCRERAVACRQEECSHASHATPCARARTSGDAFSCCACVTWHPPVLQCALVQPCWQRDILLLIGNRQAGRGAEHCDGGPAGGPPHQRKEDEGGAGPHAVAGVPPLLPPCCCADALDTRFLHVPGLLLKQQSSMGSSSAGGVRSDTGHAGRLVLSHAALGIPTLNSLEDGQPDNCNQLLKSSR